MKGKGELDTFWLLHPMRESMSDGHGLRAHAICPVNVPSRASAVFDDERSAEQCRDEVPPHAAQADPSIQHPHHVALPSYKVRK